MRRGKDSSRMIHCMPMGAIIQTPEGGFIRDFVGDSIGVIKTDTWSLDYGSWWPLETTTCW